MPVLYHHVLDEQYGRRRPLLFALTAGQPYTDSARWSLCELDSYAGRAAVLAEGHNLARQQEFHRRLAAVLDANEKYLDGEKDIPEVVDPQPELEKHVRQLLRKAAAGTVPLTVVADYLEDLKREGRLP